MIAKVCDRESRRDLWFKNRLVYSLLDVCVMQCTVNSIKQLVWSYFHGWLGLSGLPGLPWPRYTLCVGLQHGPRPGISHVGLLLSLKFQVILG